MRRLLTIVASCCTLFGCQGGTTPNANAVTPFSVSEGRGAKHEFYRGVSLDGFSDQLRLPPGSVDVLDVVIDEGPQVFAVVKVAEEPGRDLANTRFETTFRSRDGGTIVKRWKAAEGRRSGSVVGVFTLPDSIVGGGTVVAEAGG